MVYMTRSFAKAFVKGIPYYVPVHIVSVLLGLFRKHSAKRTLQRFLVNMFRSCMMVGSVS
jgi:hypothetical protein